MLRPVTLCQLSQPLLPRCDFAWELPSVMVELAFSSDLLKRLDGG